MAKTVTVIPQTRNLFTTAPIAAAARRRVAGYARVSTDSDEQFTSYEGWVYKKSMKDLISVNNILFSARL